jgi:uncharacterized protein (TIGR03382 family)
VGLFLAAASLLTAVAHASPVEQLTQVAMHPVDPNIQVVRYVNGRGGLFYTADGGRSWKLLCSGLIHRMVTPTAFAMTHEGRTLIGTTSGLWQDDGHGCAWTKEAALEGRYVADLAAHPSDPQTLFAVTATATAGSSNGILRRNADGSWTEVGAPTPLSISRLRVVATPEGLRFYETAQNGTNVIVRVSNDEGQTWQEHVVAISDGLVRLQAVDATHPDRIVISVERPEQDDLVLVSADQGATFTEYLKVTELSGVLVAADGRVWISDSGGTKNDSTTEGIWHASNLDVAPRRILEQQTRCLARRPDEETLYACLRWKYGPVDEADECVDSLLEIYRVHEMVQCAGVDMAAICEPQLCADYCRFDHFPKTPLCTVYDTDVCGPNAAVDGVSLGTSDSVDTCGDIAAPDAGAPTSDAGMEVGADGGGRPPAKDGGAEKPKPQKNTSDGCNAATSDGRPLAWLLFASLAFVVRRRRSA